MRKKGGRDGKVVSKGGLIIIIIVKAPDLGFGNNLGENWNDVLIFHLITRQYYQW